MTGCQIRAMLPADIAAARQLWVDAEGVELTAGDEPEQLARYLARNPGLSSVAADDRGRVIGAVLCGHDGRRGFVYHLAVARERRGEGIGRALMQRSLAALKVEGVTRVLLLIRTDNVGAQHFWLREGWEEMPFARPMGLDL